MPDYTDTEEMEDIDGKEESVSRSQDIDPVPQKEHEDWKAPKKHAEYIPKMHSRRQNTEQYHTK